MNGILKPTHAKSEFKTVKLTNDLRIGKYGEVVLQVLPFSPTHAIIEYVKDYNYGGGDLDID
ncbi:hypothetical protein KM908_14305 [Alkalihalobacillus clausii]|uniref:hypothetical protein n=1 Tax=Shouchella clausii TaxID=79880 RepID=UPI001B1C2D0E|nr:hypothetical protein [Shouchella clausii]MBU8597314.1 hypothetical protein [Shouchella clausii]GIN10151.1 hypothetical protein J26TS2_00180 [Shouchella clausii]